MSKSKQFSMNEDDAINYGVPEAIVLFNLRFWISKNKKKGINYHEGKYWTYNSCSKFAKIFKFYSESQISRLLISLEKKGAIVTGNFNKLPGDKTKWFALPLTDSEDPSHDIVKALPDNNTDSKLGFDFSDKNRCALGYENLEKNNANFLKKMREDE